MLVFLFTALMQIYNIWVYTTLFTGKTWINIIKSILAIDLAFIIQTSFNYAVFGLLRPFTQWPDKIL